jgi:TolB-like protein/Tfp pilus assembly protein PilF
LGYAHGHNVVHRDIKPANILIDAGHAIVTDFGIALALSTVSKRFTDPGMRVGTPEYMSPEQATAARVDGRSDLYSLACVLYEMLVGQPPFVGPSPRAVIARQVNDPPPPLATVRPDVSPAVAGAVMKALTKEPVGRFSSARTFAEALTAAAGRESATPAKSIAVLPFANMSADPENEYLSDGLGEEIINTLTKLGEFRVASRTSAFAYKGSSEDIRTIGRRLGVRAVLEGSVRRAGNRLRVTAQLISVDDGYHLWSDRYDREMEDVFAIQDEIARNIAGALQVVLSKDEEAAITRQPTANVQAYDYYLRGRQHFHRFRKRSLEFARQMFERAVELDPGYALAYTGLATSCAFLNMYWGTGAPDLERAERATERALELAPRLAEGHVARGLVCFLRKALDEAEQEFETAIASDPTLFEGYYFYARTCYQGGELERAATLFERATAVRRDYQAYFFAAQTYMALEQNARAEAAYRRALQVVQEHLDLNPGDARAVTMGAVAMCRTGDTSKGLKWAERALAIDPDDAGVTYNVACLFALEGDHDRAIECLQKALEGGFWHPEWIAHDPDLDPVRDHPRFRALLAGR